MTRPESQTVRMWWLHHLYGHTASTVKLQRFRNTMHCQGSTPCSPAERRKSHLVVPASIELCWNIYYTLTHSVKLTFRKIFNVSDAKVWHSIVIIISKQVPTPQTPSKVIERIWQGKKNRRPSGREVLKRSWLRIWWADNSEQLNRYKIDIVVKTEKKMSKIKVEYGLKCDSWFH